MPQPRPLTASQSSSYDTVADSMKNSTAKTSSHAETNAAQTSPVPVFPRAANITLPPQQQIRNIGAKSPAQGEDNGYRIVRARTESSMTSISGEWALVRKEERAAKPQTRGGPAARRQERRVRDDSDFNNSKTDCDTDFIVVEDGKDEFVPETSMRGSSPFVVTSRNSDVNDGQMIRSDVSLTRTHPASSNYNDNVTGLEVRIGIARLTTGSISAALVGVGSQFADSSPFMRIPVDDWISV